jgi:NADPH:quinone reductase-like Zn-dependent oxidoreductase
LKPVERPEPVPGAGKIVVAMKAASLNKTCLKY